MRRVLALDVLACPRCGGRLRVIATVQHPAVAAGAVIGKPDPAAGAGPKAFVVRRNDQAVTAEELLGWARGRLAGYKSLHEVEFVEAIPKTASGKILRRVLREQERQRLGLA